MNLLLWILNFSLYWTCIDAQMGFDGPLSAQEQMYILYEVKMQCHQNLSNMEPGAEDEVCPPDWDGLICWPHGSPGQVTKVPCPSYIYDFNHKGHAYRKCDVNGSWVFVEHWNKTWTNYSECLRFLQPFSDKEAKQDFFERLYIMYTTGYAVSFSSLLVAIMIIGYFRHSYTDGCINKQRGVQCLAQVNLT